MDGFCTRDDRTPSSVRCEAGDILQVANKYAAIRSELQTLSINGLISDVEYGLTGQVANSANYEQFLSNEKLGRMEVAGVHLASRFNHPARAFILLAKLYITIPGVYWPTMDVPTGPGDHSDWDICIQSSQERFVDDELRSIIERFTPGVSESTAPFFGHTAEFKQIFSEFMVLASADRVSTLDPVQLDQYLAHLHYLGSHDFVLPLRTARWFYEAVTTSATARDLARHPTVPKPAVGGCWGLAHSDWIGPSKAVQMNRVDIDWERNVTTNDFDSMVAAYWNKPRSGYPVSARVIIVETLYEIKELIGLGGSSPGGIGASFLPEQWIPLADAYRRTLNVSSAVGADSGVGDKNRYVNAIYRVLAMLDTPEFNAASDPPGEIHSVTAVKVMKLIEGDEAVLRGWREFLRLIHPEPDNSGGPDADGQPSMRMMFEVAMHHANYLWKLRPSNGPSRLFYTRTKHVPNGYPIYGLESVSAERQWFRPSITTMAATATPSYERSLGPSYMYVPFESRYGKFREFLRGEADAFGGQRTIIGIMRDYRERLGLPHNTEVLRRASFLGSGHSYPLMLAALLAGERAVTEADSEARTDPTLLTSRLYPRIHFLMMVKSALTQIYAGVVPLFMSQSDSEIADFARAVGHYRSVALSVIEDGVSSEDTIEDLLMDMSAILEVLLVDGRHGTGCIDDRVPVHILRRLDEFVTRVIGASRMREEGLPLLKRINFAFMEWRRNFVYRRSSPQMSAAGLVDLSQSLATLLDSHPPVAAARPDLEENGTPKKSKRELVDGEVVESSPEKDKKKEKHHVDEE